MPAITSFRFAVILGLLTTLILSADQQASAQFGIRGGAGGIGIGVGPGGLIPNSPGNPGYIDPFFRGQNGNGLMTGRYFYGNDGWNQYGANYRDEVDEAIRDRQQQQRPPLPTAEELEVMNYTQLRRVLRVGAMHLDQELSDLNGAEGWKKYLYTQALQENVSIEDPNPPTQQAREQLAVALKAYDQAAGNPQYQMIYRLFGFQAVRAGLKEILKPAEQHLRTYLISESAFLTSQLDQIRGGASWQRFLALPGSLSTTGQATLAPAPEVDPTQLRSDVFALLTRFDQTAENEKYKMISDLSGFKSMYEALVQLQQQTEPQQQQPEGNGLEGEPASGQGTPGGPAVPPPPAQP